METLQLMVLLFLICTLFCKHTNFPYIFYLGFVRTRLLKVDVPLDYPRDSKNLEIRHQIDLPSDDTTYWCSIHKLPNLFKKKHHAIQVILNI